MHCACRLLEFWSFEISSSKNAKKEGFVLTNEGWTLGLPERLLFDFNDATLKQSHEAELTRLANQLNKYDLNKLKIVGHTDDVGNPEYNQKLSEERAQSVANLFLTHGFKRKIFTLLGVVQLNPMYRIQPMKIGQLTVVLQSSLFLRF